MIHIYKLLIILLLFLYSLNTYSQSIYDSNKYLDNLMWGRYLLHGKFIKEQSQYIEENIDQNNENILILGENIYETFLLNENATPADAEAVIIRALKDNRRQFDTGSNLKINYGFSKTNQDGVYCEDINKRVIDNKEYKEMYSQFLIYNRAMLKARDIIFYATMSGYTGDFKEYFLYIGLTYLLEEGLKELDNIQKYFQEFLSQTKTPENIISKIYQNSLDQADFLNMIKSIISLKDTNTIKEVFETAKDNKYLDKIAFKSGNFNIYNDGFYLTNVVYKIGGKSILHIYDKPFSKNMENIYPRFFKGIKSNNQDNKVEDLTSDLIDNEFSIENYPARTCNDNIYTGNLYIIPFDNITYIVNSSLTQDLLEQVEVRNPAYFNTDYSNNYYIDPAYIINSKNGIFSMESFNYTNRVLISYRFNKEILSPIGDADLGKDYRGEKLDKYAIDKLYSNSKSKIFKNKNNISKEESYIKYLQQYIDYKIDNISIYNTNVNNGKNKDTLLISAEFYNKDNKKKEIFFIVDNSTLEVINEKLIKAMINTVENKNYYKSIIYISHNNKKVAAYIAVLKTDNSVQVFNVIDQELGQSDFPIYDYKLREEETIWQNFDPLSLFSYNKLLNCETSTDVETIKICSSRDLLTKKLYIDMLYKKSLEKAKAAGMYSIILYYENAYKEMNNAVKNCSQYDKSCIMNIYNKIERVFK